MKILITGATGFIGKAIVEELQRNGIEIFCAGGTKSVQPDDLPNFYKCDITKLESIENLSGLQKIDAVIHSAGLAHQSGNFDEQDFWAVNVQGSQNIANLAVRLEIKRFILVSSVAVYGNHDSFSMRDRIVQESFISEEFKCQPIGAYAKSKLEAERKVLDICQKNNIALTILRLATVIGERDRGNVWRLIKAIDEGKFIWIGNGENYKSLIYKGDVAKACLKILKMAKNDFEIFNLTCEPIRMKEIVSEIAGQLNKSLPNIKIPPSILLKSLRTADKLLGIRRISVLSGTIEKWLSEEKYSGGKIKSDYGFETETSIQEALEREVRSYLKGR